MALLLTLATGLTAAPTEAQEWVGPAEDGWEVYCGEILDPGYCGPLYSVPMMMGTHEGPFATPLRITSFAATPVFATYTGASALINDVTQPATFSFFSGNPNALLPDIAAATSTPPAVDVSGDGNPGTFTGLPENFGVTQAIAANAPAPGTITFRQGQAVFVSNAPVLAPSQSLATNPSAFLPEANGDVTAAAGNAPFNGFQLQYQYLFTRAPVALVIPHPSNTSLTGRTKIAQNGSVLPRTRAFFDYSAIDAEDLAGGYTFHRFTPGVERAFFDGAASVEVRVPIALTADSAISADHPFTEGNVEYGNASLALKALMVRTARFALSGGLQMAFPTGSDTHVTMGDGIRVLEVENEAVHVMPFVGAIYDSPSMFFTQMFAQFDIDVNGNSVRGNPTLAPGSPLVSAPHLNDVDRFYLDIGTGLWLYRAPDSMLGPMNLVGFAPTLEFHYTQGLGRPDVVRLGSLQVGDASDTIENLDVVVGASAIFPAHVVTAGVGAPITGDKTHDWEFRLLINHAIR